MNNIGIALTGDDRQLLQILQQMEGHLKNLNAVAVKAMDRTQAAAEQTAGAMREVQQAAAGAATAVDAGSKATTAYTAATRDARVQANLLTQANRQMAMQMTDVVTSLASGMPLWMVFIQQGGQIKDAYGGVGAALRGVTGYLRTLINPVTAAVAALATIGIAAYQGSQEMAAFNRTLVLTGNAVGATAGQLDQMAARISEAAGTRSAAAAALNTLAGTAGITSGQIERIGQAAIAMQRAGGPAVEDLAKKFGELGKDPLNALVKLNEAENFLTRSVYLQVKALTDQGREAEAAAVAQAAYADTVAERAAKLEGNLGYLERAWRFVKETAGDAWNAMMNIGRQQTDESLLAAIQKQIRDAQAAQASARSDNKARYDPVIAQLRVQEGIVQARIAQEQKLSQQKKEEQEAAKALAEWDKKSLDYLSDQQKLEARLRDIQALGTKAKVDQAEIDARIAAERAKADKSAIDDGRKQLEQLEDRNALTAEQIRLGRQLTESERQRIQYERDVKAGRLQPDDETKQRINEALLESAANERRLRADEEQAKKQKELERMRQEARAARRKYLGDLEEELSKQAKLNAGLEDEILKRVHGTAYLQQQRAAREEESAAQLEAQALALEAAGVNDGESASLRRKAELLRQEAQLRKQIADLDDAAARLKAAEEERKERERNIAEMARELEAGEKQLQALRDEIALLDESKAAVRDMTAARLESAAALLEQHAAELEGVDLQNSEIPIMRKRAEQLREEAKLRRDVTTATNSKQAREANRKAAEDALKEWNRTVDQVGQSLADALLNGSMKAGEALKNYFRTLVLQPIIRAAVDPIARGITSALGLAGSAGTAAAGTAGAGAGSAAGAMGLLGSASSIFGAGAAATMSGNVMGAMGSAGAMMSGGATMQGLAMGAGAAAPIIAGVMLGRALYKSISDGYSVGGGRMMGNLLGFATGGIINRAFGTKLVGEGIRGSFGGDAGFAGQQFRQFKGGWFRSNRTSLSALDPDTQALLAGSFNELRSTTTSMARELGIAASALDDYTRSVDISLRGLTQEQIAERLGKELGLVADEMARLVGGAGATADSLRQLYQAVMSERANLETQLLQLQGDTAELRRREREALHQSNRALYDRITALQDERAAMDATLSAAQTAIQQQITASQSAANAARQAAEAYRGAGASLLDTARALRGQAAPGASAAAAYRAGLTAAQGGDVTAMQGLSGLAQTYAESLRGSARSRSQYLAGTRSIAAELEAVAGTAGGLSTQRSAQAALLDTNTAVLQVLAEDLQNGNLTVGLLQEHSRSLAAIAAALGNTGPVVQRLIGVDEGTSGVVDAQQIAGDLLASSDLTLARVLAKLGEPDANAAVLAERVQSGNQLVADRLQSVINAIGAQTAAQQAEIKRQQDLAKAQKDLESAFGYLGSLQSSLSTAQATLAGTSPTMSVRVGTRYDSFGFAKGGKYEERTNPAYQTAVDAVTAAQQTLATYAPQVDALRELIRSLGGIPAFATGGLHTGGLRLVGERGPELEVTGPARYWSAADTTAMLGNSNRREEVLAAEIRALRAEVAGLRAETRATAENTGKTRRLWERVTRDGESMQVTDVTPAP